MVDVQAIQSTHIVILANEVEADGTRITSVDKRVADARRPTRLWNLLQGLGQVLRSGLWPSTK